jgi:hypothetical protein
MKKCTLCNYEIIFDDRKFCWNCCEYILGSRYFKNIFRSTSGVPEYQWNTIEGIVKKCLSKNK